MKCSVVVQLRPLSQLSSTSILFRFVSDEDKTRIMYTLSVVLLTLLAGVRSSVPHDLVAANSDFAVRLYKRVVKFIDDENTFMSPFSVSTALAMTSGGARGKTFNEMYRVLGFDGSNYDVHEGFRNLLQKFNSSTNDDCTLTLANRLFPDEKFKLVSAFVDMTTEKYAAKVKLLDFAGKPDESRRYINKWAADATEQTIKNLLAVGDITSQTALVLANAIYFKGSWLMPFNKNLTAARPFYVSKEDSVNITMMQTTGKFHFIVNHELKCNFVELPYVGTDFAMVLVVPQEKDGLPAIEQQLNGTVLRAAIDSMQERTVMVNLPRFNITQRVNLVETLNNMGIHDLFLGSADLSGLAQNAAGLFVSGVIHKAYISVNEEGTEASAATAVVVSRAMPLQVNADRPFLFLIREKSTGSILFMGRLIEPPKDDEVEFNTAGRAAPVSIVACVCSLLMVLFVGHAF